MKAVIKSKAEPLVKITCLMTRAGYEEKNDMKRKAMRL